MAFNFKDWAGTSINKFKIGISGLWLSFTGGKLRVRNSADTADAPLVASVISASGDFLELNEDAVGAAGDFKYTIQRPLTGMAENRTVIFPTALPSNGDVLAVGSVAGGVIQLTHQTIASGIDKPVTDTTTIAFGQGATTAMVTIPANAVVTDIEVIVDTPFNGTPGLTVGITGTTSKYLGTSSVDLTQAAETAFGVSPNKVPVGTPEAIIATYSQGGATAGAARILLTYVIPS